MADPAEDEDPPSLLLGGGRLLACLLLSYYGGRVFAACKLPQISGYLLVGVLCGPHGLQLLSAELIRCARLQRGASASPAQPAVARRQPLPRRHWYCRRLRAAPG